jgi:hypothetical protein
MAPTPTAVEAAEAALYDMWATVRAHPFVTLVLLFVVRILWKRYGSDLRDVPGPFTASLTRLWKLRQMYRGDMEQSDIALHRKYGTPAI